MSFEVISSVGAIRTNPASPATLLTTSATGTQNNYAPGLVQNTVERWNGASDITITGLAGGVAGYFYTFFNATSPTFGVGHVAYFSYQGGGSSAANRFLNAITSAATPVASGGSITFFYDGTQWLLVEHNQGAPISYTPTWTNGTLGNGSLTASYTISGLAVSFTQYLLWGNTTSSAGGWTFTLPPFAVALVGGATNCFLPGNVLGTDAGVGNYVGVYYASTTAWSPYVFASPLATQWATAQPFAWGSTDNLTASSTYFTS